MIGAHVVRAADELDRFGHDPLWVVLLKAVLIFVILAGVVGGGIASQIVGDEPASTSVAMVPDDSATVDAAPLEAAALLGFCGTSLFQFR